MIRWIRKNKMAGGNPGASIAFAKEIAEYCKKYDSLSSVDVFSDICGAVGTIRFFFDFEDLASFEKFQKQYMSDPEFQKKAESVSNFFNVDDAYDVIMSSL